MKIHAPVSCPFFGAYAKFYTLADSNGNIFYVGCTTTSMEKRLHAHLLEARSKERKGSKHSAKTKRIIALNCEVVATIIEMKWVTARNSCDAIFKLRPIEQKHINKYLELGYALTNAEAKKVELPFVEKEYVGQSFRSTMNKITADQPIDECKKELSNMSQN